MFTTFSTNICILYKRCFTTIRKTIFWFFIVFIFHFISVYSIFVLIKNIPLLVTSTLNFFPNKLCLSTNSLGIVIDDRGTATGTDNSINDEGNVDFYGNSFAYLKILGSNNLLDYKYTIFYNQIE